MATSKVTPKFISHGELHRRTGVSLAHISKIYGGTRRPSVEVAGRLAAALDLTVDEVLRQIEAAVKTKRGQKRRLVA